MFSLNQCTNLGAVTGLTDFDKVPTDKRYKDWRVVLELSSLKIWCNGDLVTSYIFADSPNPNCVPIYTSNALTKIVFKEEDGLSAAKKYRIIGKLGDNVFVGNALFSDIGHIIAVTFCKFLLIYHLRLCS